jgi:hypothetical protein
MTDQSPTHDPALPPPVLSMHTAELDVVESGRPTPSRGSAALVRPPQVRLGAYQEGGIAPAIMAIVERGVRRRPGLAAAMRAEIELQVHGPYPPVRIVFADRLVLVEDRAAAHADLRIEAELADLVSLMATPLVGGIPNVFKAPGRKALGKVVYRQVRVQGRVALMRRLLAIIRI